MAMTKGQQEAVRKLNQAEQDYLWAYGWQLIQGGEWRHPKRDAGYTRREAVNETKNHPELGWPPSKR